MPALERAVALAEVNRPAVAIGQDLDLDVARIVDVLLDVDRRVCEVGLALSARRLERAPGALGRGDDLHAPATAARRGLDRDRPAVAVAQLDDSRGVADLLGRPRHDRHAGCMHALPCADLRAHGLDRLGRRADPGETGLRAGAGEAGVLRQEAVARVDRLGTAGPRGSDDPLDVQVALRGRPGPDQPSLVGTPHVQRSPVGLGVHGHRADAELAQGTEHADGDLTAIGDEHLAEQRRVHGRGSLDRPHGRGLTRTVRA